jgi:cytoskeletal protein RodZ
MLRHTTDVESSDLGEYLRDTRVHLNMDLLTVAEETKIPSKCLQAIEENNFAALPAEAFARGFYALYAKALELDPAEILQRYTQERPKRSRSELFSIHPRSKQAQEVGNMAERPTFLPFSLFGLTLLLLLILGGFLCWYFSWNPATFLSQKLRSLESPPEFAQVYPDQTDSSISNSVSRSARLQNLPSTHSDFFSIASPSTAIASTIQKMHENPTQAPSQISFYYLDAVFNNEAKTNLSLNDNLLNPSETDKRCVSPCLPDQLLQ